MPRASAGRPSSRRAVSFAERYRDERDRLACALRRCSSEERGEWAACLLLRLIFVSCLRSGRRNLSRRWLVATIREIPGPEADSAEFDDLDLTGQTTTSLLDFLANAPSPTEDLGEFSALLEALPESDARQKPLGVYATGADVADYLARNTILPCLLAAVARSHPALLCPGAELWRLLAADPDRYLHAALSHGVDELLPSDVSARIEWNRPVPSAFGPISETWRTHLTRRERCHDLRNRLRGEQAQDLAELIANNLDLARLVNDLIDCTTDERLLSAIWDTLQTLSVLDPTCGTGAFLFAALRTLEPLYAACLRRTNASPSRFGILSRIVRNNLHGVDLMREAVEIARLRLRLELVATATSAEELALIPHIADNLRVGNALVGRAQDDGRTPPTPFDWPDEFPAVTKRGGFDVVLGNPPYLELRQVNYVPHGFTCEQTGAIHALCVERSLQLLQPDGYLGMVLPLAVASTQRMRCVQRLLEEGRHVWYAHFSWRPAKLFPAVNRAVTTVLATWALRGRTWSTGYQQWFASERPSLMERIAYVEVPRQRSSFWVPKLATPGERPLLEKLLSIPTVVGDFTVADGGESAARVYYRTDGGLYWKVFTDFPPTFAVGGRAGHSTREDWITLANATMVAPLIAALSSDLFWWWYTITSNCRHLNPTDIQQFPLPATVLADTRLADLGGLYLADIIRNSTMAVRRQRQTGHTETQSFKIHLSRGIIEQIDSVLARHYGMTPEELDFVEHYDIRFRMGTARR